MGLGVPGWSREGPGARPGPGPGCWGTRAEGIRLAQRRRPPPGHPGSPGGCSSRRGRRAGGGVGAPHLGRGGGSGGRRLPLCPPDIAAAPAAGCRDEAAAEFSVPATPSRGACGQGYFLTYLKASVGSRVLPLLRPAHFAPFLLAMLVVLLSGIDCFLGRSLPARNALLQS